MHVSTHTAVAAPLRLLSAALGDTLNALRGAAQKLDAWLEARGRAAADRDTLASMSDRELQDIGLDRARANFIAVGVGMHDYPC